MDLKHGLTIYINDLTLIQKELQINDESSKLDTIFTYMENYYEQIESIKSPRSSIFKSESHSLNTQKIPEKSKIYNCSVNRQDLKQKLMFKLNQLVNEKIKLIEAILY